MKKAKDKTLKIKEFADLVQKTTLKEVAPPEGANRNMLSGKSEMTIKEATATWFKTAKKQDQDAGFLKPTEDIDVKKAVDREILYKGNKE